MCVYCVISPCLLHSNVTVEQKGLALYGLKKGMKVGLKQCVK